MTNTQSQSAARGAVCRRCGSEHAPGAVSCADCGSVLRPPLLDVLTLLWLFGSGVWALVQLGVLACVGPGWFPYHLAASLGLPLTLASISILVGLRCGRYWAWILTQVVLAFNLAVHGGFVCILFCFEPTRVGADAVAIVGGIPFLTHLILVFLILVYLHRHHVKAFCSARTAEGEIKPYRIVLGGGLAVVGTLLLLFWSMALREWSFLASIGPGKAEFIEATQALDWALQIVYFDLPAEPWMRRTQDILNQFVQAVRGHHAFAALLLFAGWTVAMWHPFATRELARCMTWLRRSGLATCGVLGLVALLLLPRSLVSDVFLLDELAEAEREIDAPLPKGLDRDIRVAPQEIFVNIAHRGEIFVLGKTVTLAELETILARAKETNPEQSVVIRADKRSDFGYVWEVLELVRRMGLENWRLAAIGDQENGSAEHTGDAMQDAPVVNQVTEKADPDGIPQEPDGLGISIDDIME